MNIATRICKTTLAGAISIAASWACASPVDVSFATSGSPGDWLLDFTVANNIASPPDGASIYLFALQLQPGDFGDIPDHYFPLAGPFGFLPSDGSPEASYDFGWLDLDFASGGVPHLSPLTSQSGFFLHSYGIDAPGSFSWAVAAVSIDDDGSEPPLVITYQGVAGVPAIPEPSTYGLMLLGIAALGLYGRGKRSIGA